jgi:ATP-binding protein involved in chromosome partitioning
MERIGQKILVLSGKGGVGKSTVAANLAISLAEAGKTVGLLDIDVHGPSIPKLMGLVGRRPQSDGSALNPVEVAENLKVMSIGFLVDSREDAVIWRGPMKYNVIRQFLKDVTWGRLDYLVIDSPPGTGDEPLAVAQLVGRPASALIVTTPQDLAVADVRRSISFCQALDLPVLGVIENMSGLVCPHCDRQIDLFKVGGGESLAEEMGVPFLGRIPLDPRIVASGDSGQPFVQAFAGSPAAKAFARVVTPILRPHQARPVDVPESPTQGEKMKIAIPVANGKVCMHFGHCEQFALVEVDETSKAITATSYLTPPAHEPGVLPRWLHAQSADVIITGGMGQRAQGLFAQNGIKVVVGAPAETPEDVVTAYLSGTLKVGQNVCDH